MTSSKLFHTFIGKGNYLKIIVHKSVDTVAISRENNMVAFWFTITHVYKLGPFLLLLLDDISMVHLPFLHPRTHPETHTCQTDLVKHIFTF